MAEGDPDDPTIMSGFDAAAHFVALMESGEVILPHAIDVLKVVGPNPTMPEVELTTFILTFNTNETHLGAYHMIIGPNKAMHLAKLIATAFETEPSDE